MDSRLITSFILLTDVVALWTYLRLIGVPMKENYGRIKFYILSFAFVTYGIVSLKLVEIIFPFNVGNV